ncbi:MAG: GDSL-type esterase/lipase family protein [Bauldia sp.]
MRRRTTWIAAGAVAIVFVVAVVLAFRYLPGPAPEPPPEPEPLPPEVAIAEPPPPDAPPVAVASERHEGIVVLHIGDSHTAADFFTGRVRDILERSYGKGGVVLPPGTPQAGVRSNVFRIEATPGWSYERIRASAEHPSRFWLTGFTAEARSAGQEITFEAYQPMPFTAIDVSLVAQPAGGAVELLLDGEPIETLPLDGPDEALIRRVIPVAGIAEFENLTIRSTNDGPVILTGVTVYRYDPSISYLSVGYPGARADLLLDFNADNLANDLARLDPDIIVVAFGTNEGYDDNLNIDRFREEYTEIIGFLAEHADNLQDVVIVQPPYGSREGGRAGPSPDGYACFNVPANLIAVRETLAEIAGELGAVTWDWAASLPSPCTGNTAAADMYAADRLHLSNDGYRYSAERFADFLETLLPAPTAVAAP